MLTITSERNEPFSLQEITASGLRSVFRVLTSPEQEGASIVEVLTPRRRSHLVVQAAPSDLPAELLFDTEGSDYVMFCFHGPDISVKAFARALKRERFAMVAS